ncbi:MAG: sugar ABC transporter substrate-binding protein [Spirochaetales bacterium]|nr:sugar ABC transporter substrate-binding protein [Spirochaetales bacterium]
MKKLLTILVAVALLISPVFAQGAAEKNDTVTLTFVEVMTSPERTLVLEEAIAAFEAENPNIKIDLVSPPYEQAETKLASMLQAGQDVDICEIRDNSVATLINAGLLADIGSQVDSWGAKDQLVEAALLAGASMGDTTYFIPQYLYIKGLMVRTDILKEKGIALPKTLDEFYAACAAVADPAKGQYSLAIRGKGTPCKTTDIMMLPEVANINEDNLYFTKDGTFYLNTEGGKKAMNDYLNLFKNSSPSDAVNWGYAEQINGFISGTTPFLFQDPDAVGSVKDALDESQYTVIPVPTGASGKRYLDYGFAGLAVAENSKHKEEAFKFIQYMVSAEVNARICEFYGALPVNKGAYEISDMFSMGIYKAWSDAISGEDTVFVKFPLSDPRFTEYGTVHMNAMQNMLLGKASVDDTIKILSDFWTK